MNIEDYLSGKIESPYMKDRGDDAHRREMARMIAALDFKLDASLKKKVDKDLATINNEEVVLSYEEADPAPERKYAFEGGRIWFIHIEGELDDWFVFERPIYG